MEALDWGILLKTEEVSDNISYIGIRAHDIRPSDDKTIENTLPCNCIRITDSPFEKNLIINSNSNELWWKISKSYWINTLNEKLPDYIRLPKEHLMLLE
ncbi:hypothetical protein [Anaerocolumna sedimenticola]|uniref:hypothetical protein n=1 Tax=Anaerocolumna sedimenticola TaxID=2696063 RepID=UPI002ED2F1C1